MPPTPLSYWIGFHLLLLLLLAAEGLYSRRKGSGQLHATAAASTLLWVTAALLLAAGIYLHLGASGATQYLASYAIEESLSVDNLFVFLLLFRLFQIVPANQPRVLFWGVAGAVVMRGAFITGGLGLLNRFHQVSYIFAAVLLVAAIRLLIPQKTTSHAAPRWITWLQRLHPVSLRQDHFVVRETVGEGGKTRTMVTVLFLALIAIELTDIVFALDSIPAVLSITRHAFIAYTSNIMAVMGLRSLYFLLASLLERLRYLHYGLAAVLIFAASKLLAARWIDLGPLTSLAVIVLVLAITVAASLLSSPQPEL